MKQLIRYLKGTQHTCLRLEPRGMVQKGLLEVVKLGRRFRNAPKRYGISVQCAGRNAVQPSVSVRAKQSSTQPVLAQESSPDSQTSSRNCTTTFQFVSRWIQIRQDTFYSAEDQADSSTSKYDAWIFNSGDEKNVCRWREWTRMTILQISSRNIWMDRDRSRSQGNLDFESWKVRFVMTESFRTALPVAQGCKYSQF